MYTWIPLYSTSSFVSVNIMRNKKREQAPYNIAYLYRTEND